MSAVKQRVVVKSPIPSHDVGFVRAALVRLDQYQPSNNTDIDFKEARTRDGGLGKARSPKHPQVQRLFY